MFRKICYKTLMSSIKWGNHDGGSESTPKDVAWPVVTLCQECDGPSKKWFEGRSRKSSGSSENKFHLFCYCCISGTMVCLRRTLSSLVVLYCCCLLNIVGLIHSFGQRRWMFDVCLTFKYHRFMRLDGTLGWHVIVFVLDAPHSERKQVQKAGDRWPCRAFSIIHS